MRDKVRRPSLTLSVAELLTSLLPLLLSPHRFSRPLEVRFRPEVTGLYRCRFRFVVEEGEGFDVVLEGRGTYQEGRWVGR